MQQAHVNMPSTDEINQMNREIMNLKDRARKSRFDARRSFHTQMRAVEDHYDLVVARMNRVARRGEGISEELQAGLSQAWGDLKDSFDRASRYIQ